MARWAAIVAFVLAAVIPAGGGIAWGVEVVGSPTAAPIAASPDTALSGRLPGAASYGDAYCARVAGNISDTTATCGDSAASLALAPSAEVEPGEPGVALRPDGSQATYEQAFSEAASTGKPMAFWAGGAAESADYVLYIALGSAWEGYADFRLVQASESDSSAMSARLGRSDFLAFGFAEEGGLPAGTELYVRVSSLFGNDTYVDVLSAAEDGEAGGGGDAGGAPGGAFAEIASGVPVRGGYVHFPIASRSAFVIVNASDEAAAAASTDEWFDEIQIQPDGPRQVPVGLVVGLAVGIVVVAVAVALAVRSTRRKAAAPGVADAGSFGNARLSASANPVERSAQPAADGALSGKGRRSRSKGRRGGLS